MLNDELQEERMVAVDIWSDVVCPFCFIGKRRLEAAAAEEGVPLEVTWRAFELNPDAPAIDPRPLAERIAQKYGRTIEQAEQSQRQIADMAAHEGIEFNWTTARGGNTFNAHRLAKLAAMVGVGDRAQDVLMRRYFTDGEPIGANETLLAAGLELGMSGEDVAALLASDAFADEVRQDQAIARDELQVEGVPFFVFARKYAISGAQPREYFRAALRKIADETAGA
ncbi:MAG: DsbA family oxidoreductase [Methylobacteriaceae bacterium]|nr:DsbA family oxidoreductase [Methylobacteriaceae bacterium]